MSRTDLAYTVVQSLRAWVIALTGLDNDHVIPASLTTKSNTRPSKPYVTIGVIAAQRSGPVDELRHRLVQTAEVDAATSGDVAAITLDGTEIASVTWGASDTPSTVAAALGAFAEEAEGVLDVVVDGATLYLAADGDAVWSFAGLTDGEMQPTIRSWGPKASTISIVGYGDAAGAILDRLARRAFLPVSIEQLENLGLALEPLGEPTFVADLLDTSPEGRFAWDLVARYELASDREPIDTADSATIATTFTGSSTLSTTIDVDLTS